MTMNDFKKNRELSCEFINQGEEQLPWKNVISLIFLGSDTFIQKIRNRATSPISRGEIPLIDRYAGKPTLNDIFKDHLR